MSRHVPQTLLPHGLEHMNNFYLEDGELLHVFAGISLAQHYRQVRLVLMDRGMVNYTLKTARRDGTTARQSAEGGIPHVVFDRGRPTFAKFHDQTGSTCA